LCSKFSEEITFAVGTVVRIVCSVNNPPSQPQLEAIHITMSEEEYDEIEELPDEEGEEEEDPKAGEDEEDKFELMGDSTQTDEDRRAIRRAQRDLFKEMEEKGENLKVDDARGKNNEIFKNVRFTREAVLDGENLTLIANKAIQQVDRLIQVRPHNYY
jgi:DNA phosphorothioation-dependent restriction protein DptG